MPFEKKSREEFFRKAKKKVRQAISSRDNLLIQSVGAVDELNKASNLLFERLTEWYGMHFPEFKTPDNAKYVEGVLVIDREKPDVAELEKIFGQQAGSIAGRARASVGSKFSDEDFAKVRALASQIKQLWKLRDEIEAYEAKTANEICRTFHILQARSLRQSLWRQAGGLQRLATFPASTVQVLGAGKSAF